MICSDIVIHHIDVFMSRSCHFPVGTVLAILALTLVCGGVAWMVVRRGKEEKSIHDMQAMGKASIKMQYGTSTKDSGLKKKLEQKKKKKKKSRS